MVSTHVHSGVLSHTLVATYPCSALHDSPARPPGPRRGSTVHASTVARSHESATPTAKKTTALLIHRRTPPRPGALAPRPPRPSPAALATTTGSAIAVSTAISPSV